MIKHSLTDRFFKKLNKFIIIPNDEQTNLLLLPDGFGEINSDVEAKSFG